MSWWPVRPRAWESVTPRGLWSVLEKQFSLNTVHFCIQKRNLKLYYTKRESLISTLCRNTTSSLDTNSSRVDRKARVLWSDESTVQLLFEIIEVLVLHAKDNKNHTSQSVHPCMREGTIDAEVYIGLWRDVYYHKGNIFSWKPNSDFNRPIPDLILHDIQLCGLICLQSRCASCWK